MRGRHPRRFVERDRTIGTVKVCTLYEFDMEGIVLPGGMRIELLSDFLHEAIVAKLNALDIAAMRPGSGRHDERIVIRGRVLSADGGSRLKRYFLPFVAGAAKVVVRGEVLDSGERVAELEAVGLRRIGINGGDSRNLVIEAGRIAGEKIGDQVVAAIERLGEPPATE